MCIRDSSAPLLFAQVDWVQNNRFLQPIIQALQPGYPWYVLLNMLGIIFFAYFYISIVIDVYKRQVMVRARPRRFPRRFARESKRPRRTCTAST